MSLREQPSGATIRWVAVKFSLVKIHSELGENAMRHRPP
jgi:hypothetical protein